MTINEAKQKVVDWCNNQVGTREGDNNWNKYADNADLIRWSGWRPQNQPWCDVFADSAYLECFGLEKAAKMTYQPIGSGTALCRASAQNYKNHGAWFNTPEVGDQVFFFYDGDINHIGIVTQVGMGAITTVEGNSSDMVSRRVYSLSSPRIAGYGRPDWFAVCGYEDEPKEDSKEQRNLDLPVLRKGDKGEVVRAAQFLLNGRGASCGVWGADGDFGSATEAAVLAFQRRNGLVADGIIGAQTWAALLGVSK